MPRILVPIKPAALGAPRVELAPGGGLAAAVDQRLDPINELTLEWAVRQLEAGEVAGVTAISIGGGAAEVALRAARTRGATDVRRVDPGDVDVDVATVAALIAAVARELDADIVALGHESYDSSGGVVPGATAAVLDRPLVARARDAAVRGATLVADRAGGHGGREMLTAGLPVVVSLVEGEVVARNPRLAAVIAARSATVPVLAADALLADRELESWPAGLVAVAPVAPTSRRTTVVGADDGIPAILAAINATSGGEAA